MFASKFFRGLLGCVLLMSFAGAANAFTITIERLNDTKGLVTGDGNVTDNVFITEGVLGSSSTSGTQTLPSNAFYLDGTNLLLQVAADGSGNLEFSFPSDKSGGLSGSVVVSLLSGNSWAPIGSSGDISVGGDNVGTWSIIAPVAEPGSLALLGLGLAGLGMSRRRKAD